MSRLRPSTTVLVAALGVTLVGGAGLMGAQAPAPSAPPSSGGEVLRTGNFSPIVDSLERSLAFYHGVLGLEVPAAAAAPGPRPYSVNPGLHAMLGTTGAKERHSDARIPGSTMGVEMIEFGEIDRKTVHARVQDPGAVTIVMLVRDVDALLGHLKQSGVPVMTPGGSPVTAADGTRSVLVQDPDARPIELRQLNVLPETTAPASSNIIGARLSITVGDTERTLHVYRDLLGFQVETEPSFVSDRTLQALAGVKGGTVRRSRAQAPGSKVWFEFLEFKGLDRTALKTRIQDPGTARLQLMVRDIESVIGSLKSAGATVVSDGGKRAALPPNLWGAMMADPNNLYLSLLESCDGCAPRRPTQEAPPTRP